MKNELSITHYGNFLVYFLRHRERERKVSRKDSEKSALIRRGENLSKVSLQNFHTEQILSSFTDFFSFCFNTLPLASIVDCCDCLNRTPKKALQLRSIVDVYCHWHTFALLQRCRRHRHRSWEELGEKLLSCEWNLLNSLILPVINSHIYSSIQQVWHFFLLLHSLLEFASSR